MILLGKRIKELRTKYNLTQAELAQQVGVTTATITAYECDSRQPSYEVLIKLAYTFKVSIDSLLLNRSEDIIDVSGLTTEQINNIQNLVNYFKNSDFVDVFCSNQQLDPNTIQLFRKKHPELFKKI